MSDYFESELERIVATADENERISSEYTLRFFRVFLTVSEAKEILKIIQSYKDHQIVQSTVAS